MTPAVIVTLTRFPDVFKTFVESVRAHCPKSFLLVIKDGDEDYGTMLDDVAVFKGEQPFSHPRNLNIALRATKPWDMFYCNDDITLLGDGTMATLERIAYSNPQIGILAPTVHGGVGNMVQTASQWKWGDTDWVESRERLAFCSVYIKRATISLVGLLDERFDGYGGDDTDFCWRAQQAGLRLAVTNKVQVKHGHGDLGCSASYTREMGDKGVSVAAMSNVLEEKWGKSGTRILSD